MTVERERVLYAAISSLSEETIPLSLSLSVSLSHTLRHSLCQVTDRYKLFISDSHTRTSNDDDNDDRQPVLINCFVWHFACACLYYVCPAYWIENSLLCLLKWCDKCRLETWYMKHWIFKIYYFYEYKPTLTKVGNYYFNALAFILSL